MANLGEGTSWKQVTVRSLLCWRRISGDGSSARDSVLVRYWLFSMR